MSHRLCLILAAASLAAGVACSSGSGSVDAGSVAGSGGHAGTGGDSGGTSGSGGVATGGNGGSAGSGEAGSGGGQGGQTGGAGSSGGGGSSGGAGSGGAGSGGAGSGGAGSGGKAGSGGAGASGAAGKDAGAPDTAGSGGSGGATGGSTGGGTGGTGGTPVGGSGGGSPITGPWPPSANFTNPIMWQDIPDPEVIQVDGAYYYTGSNMHYSPGAPILRSWDLVNWEFIGHALPVMDFNSKYDLNNGQAYIKGDWASSLAYKKSNKTYYWMGCIEFSKTYVYTAPAPEGPWTRKTIINNCYYDCGILQDYDTPATETMYVAYGGGGKISVAQLSDTLTQVKAQQVYSATYTLEGSHFFKYKGNYYITPTRPANAEFVLKASDPFGPYTSKALVDNVGGPVSGGAPHQGSLFQTTAGDWYYMAFQDVFPGGRIPVLAPVTWSADGWPSVTLGGGKWATTYPYPNVPKPPRATKPHTGVETFRGGTLPAEYEWNHNPDNTKWSIKDGVVLQTATVTNDLFRARNTLTRRSIGPQSTATIKLDVSSMKEGDVAGLVALRHMSAYVGVKKSGGTTKITMVNGLALDKSTWNTTSTGAEAASAAFSGNTIWFRLALDVRNTGKTAKFSYSTDGSMFTAIGPTYALSTDWEFYPGYRFGVFNFATTALGGSVTLKSFEVTMP